MINVVENVKQRVVIKTLFVALNASLDVFVLQGSILMKQKKSVFVNAHLLLEVYCIHTVIAFTAISVHFIMFYI